MMILEIQVSLLWSHPLHGPGLHNRPVLQIRRLGTNLNASLEGQVPKPRLGRLVLLHVKLSRQCSSSYLTYGPHLRQMDFEDVTERPGVGGFFPKIYRKM